MAFTQGAAVLIISSQLPSLIGLSHWGGVADPAAWHLPALGFGLAALGLLMLVRRWRPGFPSVLVLVVLSAAVSAAIGFETRGGEVIGTLPQGLPTAYWPSWPGWATLSQLLVPTLIITLVSFLETASSAKVDNAKRGARWDQDQDLIGQGLAKLASGFSGAFPTSSSFSRSALNLYAGAQTGWATIFSVVVVLLALVLLTPWLHAVPRAVLAAIVVLPVTGLIKPQAFVQLWRLSRVEAVIAAITFAITVAAAPALYWGVIAGVLMSLSHFLYLRMHPRIIEVGLHPDGSLRDRHLWKLPPLAPQLYALRMDAALDFATAAGFERAIADHLGEHPDTRHVMLIAHPINWADATGAEAFGRVQRQLAEQHITLHLVGLKLPVENLLRQGGHLPSGSDMPWLRTYRTEAEALAALPHLTPTSPHS
jgi:SulP family sulfate permease